ncbi:MAG: DUF2924 domain-containing protein [Alphaproteobacteria bacterium]|nr:DUF2924 domain-containing protein [Alphaproteobacteria bacterium]
MTVLARLNTLKTMSINDLKAEWARLFDAPAPNNSGPYLRMRLGHRIQELTYGGLSKPARRMLDLLVDEVEGGKVRKSMISDPRTPVVGTRLIREWDGIEHTITVLRDGFEWQGRQYKSLSAIARAITGTRWNGFRFFGLSGSKRWVK